MKRSVRFAERIGIFTRLCAGAAVALAFAGAAAPVSAQNLYTPVVKVGDDAITLYERNQRVALLRILGAPGDVTALATNQLIDERLQKAEADRLGIVATEEQIQEGMAEFAARGNLDIEQMLQLLAQNGVAAETFRDFVANGFTWREVARAKFIPLAAPTDAEIDRAYAEAKPQPGVKFLLTEIVLPASSPESLKASLARADRLSDISEPEEFSRSAKRFSVAPSRQSGGMRDWLDLQALPPEVQAAVRNVSEGQATRPIELEDGGVAVFFVRDRETITSPNVGTLIEYAALYLAGGRSDAALAAAQKLRGEVDTCDDLYPAARGLPEDQLIREELPASAVPAAYRAELDKLDPGEVSTNVSQGNSLVFLMLCNRRNAVPDSVSRTQIANGLLNQRIGSLANDYVQELRAQARIEVLR